MPMFIVILVSIVLPIWLCFHFNDKACFKRYMRRGNRRKDLWR